MCVVPYILYKNSTFNLAKSLKIFLRCAVTFRKLKKPQLIFGGCVYQQIRWYNVIAVVFVLQMRTLRAEKSICLSQDHVVSGRAEPRTQNPVFPLLGCVFPPHSCSLASDSLKKAVVLIWEQSGKGLPCLLEAGMGGRGQRRPSLKTCDR